MSPSRLNRRQDKRNGAKGILIDPLSKVRGQLQDGCVAKPSSASHESVFIFLNF
jgi:hypothetical protein